MERGLVVRVAVRRKDSMKIFDRLFKRKEQNVLHDKWICVGCGKSISYEEHMNGCSCGDYRAIMQPTTTGIVVTPANQSGDIEYLDVTEEQKGSESDSGAVLTTEDVRRCINKMKEMNKRKDKDE